MNSLSVRRSYNLSDFSTHENSETGFNVEGHAAVFGQTVSIGGYFNEVIERGAFDGCDLSDVSLLVNHDLGRIPLARSRISNGNSTMKLQVDERGLFIQASLDIENNLEARTLHSSLKRGDIDGMSFAFFIADEEWENLDSDCPTRRIKKISRVYEVSAVTYPAYDATDISARDKQNMEEAKRALEKVKEPSKNHEIELEQLRAQILMKG